MCFENRCKKSILRWMIAGILCVVLWIYNYYPVHAADMGSCGDDLTWSLSDGVLTLYGSGDMLEYSDGAFPGWYGQREEIREIVLPEGLTSISDFAFIGCNQVTVVSIPDSVTRIGEYAFAQCTQLVHVNLGTGVETIGNGAFQECEALASVSFPASVTRIGSKAFYRCYSLQTLTIPETVTEMGASVFAYCIGLVRAQINAPLEVLPDWTFYGCESLSDVSLASTITAVGEFAFQNCESIKGIYTQGGNLNTAHDLKQSIPEGDSARGTVGTFDMPATSVVTKDDGSVYSETKVTQMEDTVVSVQNATDYSGGQNKMSLTVSAITENRADWTNIALAAEETLQSADGTPVTTVVQLVGNTVEGEDLARFAGKSLVLQITTGNGVIWKIDMSQMSQESFSGSYDLSVVVSQTDAVETQLESDRVFKVVFSDEIDFYATVGIQAGQTHQLATLYQKTGKEYETIETIVVDNDNYAWFALASVDERTDYYLALNVSGVTLEEAVVPGTMFEEYGMDEGLQTLEQTQVSDEESHLMDKDGVTYRITGRTSKWGITGKQFASFVAVFMIAIVLVVGTIMTTLNIIKRSKEKYQRMEEENQNGKAPDLDEEELRIEIIRELLEGSDRD